MAGWGAAPSFTLVGAGDRLCDNKPTLLLLGSTHADAIPAQRSPGTVLLQPAAVTRLRLVLERGKAGPGQQLAKRQDVCGRGIRCK